MEGIQSKPQKSGTNQVIVQHTGGVRTEPINDALKEHSAAAVDWKYREAARILHEWVERFNTEFQLGLDTPAIRLDPMSMYKLGTYHTGRNGFGLKHQITLNTRYLDRPLAEHLETLLHEMIHQWQRLYGKSGQHNYHNRQFRNKLRLYGIVADDHGRHLGIEPGPFTALLAKHGVDTASLKGPDEAAFPIRRRGHSKMRKYCCGCTTVRCAVDLAAHCDRCALRFEEAPPAW